MIKFSINPEQELEIESESIQLCAIQPVLNGALFLTEPNEVHAAAGNFVIRYLIDASAYFWVQLKHDRENRIALCYWIENLSQEFVLDSFGIHFGHVENVRAFLRNGYFSWDGSEYLQTGVLQRVQGYAMTQLLSRDRDSNIVLGFERHDRFQHTFTFSIEEMSTSLTIETHWDRKTREGNERCESETLILFEHDRVEEALREWANVVAMQSPVPPRHAARIMGWCSWYNLYAYITEQNIVEHLRGVQAVARREHLQMRVFQIDDGFTPEMGDWLDVKPQFPRGMKALLNDIRTAGFTPGLWIAPFMVGNRSLLFQAHPDWVVHERETGEPLAQMKFYDEFRWHKRSEEYYILDTTHPDAFEYLKKVFRVWRHEWGCEYFKTDFMHFGSEHGAARALFHVPGMTRIEMWRRVAEMIRTEIGDALWLGCGLPLWASVGLVDAVRIGRDVGTAWNGDRASASLLRDGATRNFANGILWQADPDCILLRERFHSLGENEVQALALFGGLLGGVLMTSDALDELPADRLRLWKFLLDTTITTCDFPFLGQVADPLLVQICHTERFDAVFLLNTSELKLTRTYAWETLGVKPPKSISDWTGNHQAEATPELHVSLEAHQGILLRMETS